MHDENTFPVEASESSAPVETADTTVTNTVSGGRRSGRTSAIRAGGLLGTALVVLVGSAVVLGASPSAPGAGAGGATASADPSAKTGKPDGGQGNGRGLGPFRMFVAGRGNGPAGGPQGLGGVRGGAFGHITVKSISGSSVSLATDDGWTRTISVTADVKITKGGETAALSDLKVGDVIRLGQKHNDDGSWTVTGIAIVLPRTAGIVTAVGSDTITITVRGGTSQTIHTTSSTKYHRDRADGTRADVKVGSIIGAVGDRATDGTFTATSVSVSLPRVAGLVDKVGTDSITIKHGDGTTVTIHVDSGTTFSVDGSKTATLKDVKAGMRIVARGLQRADGSLDADAVRAGQPGKKAPKNDAPKAAPGSSAPSGGNG
jgi:Domain of unknown function (DUF5666)